MKLFIPGPVDVCDEVLAAMSQEMIGHRSRKASELQEEISRGMQDLMYTRNTILLSSSSGSGLMEGAARSCTRHKAAVFSEGAFGERWYKMFISNGLQADIYRVEPGQATEAEQVEAALRSGDYDLVTVTHNETATGVAAPLEEIAEVMRAHPDVVWALDCVSSLGGQKIEVDRLGIDICITSSQKCLGLPPGLAIASVSEKAFKAAEKVQNRGLYFDYLELKKFIETKPFQYPSTPALSLYFALATQLKRIAKEGKEARFERHAAMAQRCRVWAKQRFSLLAEESRCSQTVTCVRNDLDIDIKQLSAMLVERGYLISDGYGPLKQKTFRIAHMADHSMEDLNALLACMDDCIDLCMRNRGGKA